MAVFVEANVVREFLEGSLLPDSLAELDMLKDDLGDDKFCLPVVLSVHVLPLTGDISDAVVVCDCELFEVL